jgi:hypothetical protein
MWVVLPGPLVVPTSDRAAPQVGTLLCEIDESFCIMVVYRSIRSFLSISEGPVKLLTCIAAQEAYSAPINLAASLQTYSADLSVCILVHAGYRNASRIRQACGTHLCK